MSHYERLISMKFSLQTLHKELNTLKKAEPTEENLAAVNAIEKKVREIQQARRTYAAAHGMAA